jgi:hypothetical protein
MQADAVTLQICLFWGRFDEAEMAAESLSATGRSAPEGAVAFWAVLAENIPYTPSMQ